MKHFSIIGNENKDRDLILTGQIIKYLEKNGCRVFLINKHETDDDLSEKVAATECIIVVGGDGSMIRVGHLFAHLDIPFIGINKGRVGFLTEIEPDEFYEKIDALINDNYYYEKRMILEGYPEGEEESNTAINDIVIARGERTQLIRYTIYVNNERLYTYNGDGLIISTPTGSTGYSLSAGGPIVSPEAALILITPICAQTLNSRSVVLSSDDEIKVECEELQSDRITKASVYIDGQLKHQLYARDIYHVRKSSKTYKMVRLKKESFMDTLRKKMSD